MHAIAPPTVVSADGLSVVTPGSDYESVYENMLVHFDGVLELVRSTRPLRLIVDLRNVKFVGSAFLALLLRMSMCVAQHKQGWFGIRNLSPYCREALQTTRLDRVLNVCEEPVGV